MQAADVVLAVAAVAESSAMNKKTLFLIASALVSCSEDTKIQKMADPVRVQSLRTGSNILLVQDSNTWYGISNYQWPDGPGQIEFQTTLYTDMEIFDEVGVTFGISASGIDVFRKPSLEYQAEFNWQMKEFVQGAVPLMDSGPCYTLDGGLYCFESINSMPATDVSDYSHIRDVRQIAGGCLIRTSGTLECLTSDSNSDENFGIPTTSDYQLVPIDNPVQIYTHLENRFARLSDDWPRLFQDRTEGVLIQTEDRSLYLIGAAVDRQGKHVLGTISKPYLLTQIPKVQDVVFDAGNLCVLSVSQEVFCEIPYPYIPRESFNYPFREASTESIIKYEIKLIQMLGGGTTSIQDTRNNWYLEYGAIGTLRELLTIDCLLHNRQCEFVGPDAEFIDYKGENVFVKFP